MRTKLIFSILLFSLLLTISLSAENHMELIWEGVGEFDESRYGGSITTLDFNHDGIDDLVVGSYEWSSNLNQSGPDQGKIYVYYGGTQFDTIPDLTADGSCYDYTTRLGEHIINIGDVNGDGC